MKTLVLALLCALFLPARNSLSNPWIFEQHAGYTLAFTETDRAHRDNYVRLIDSGLLEVQAFFGQPFPRQFDVYIHPNRTSLDSTWQRDWQAPDFRSECWMVASGVAAKLDALSPAVWDRQACEHPTTDTAATRKLFAHELVHVFHGQHNPSPDFSAVSGLDWLVEGLATYASGQCDSARMAEVFKAIADKKTPRSLDQFWSGKLKYGLSGSVALYLDRRYGRQQLLALLALTEKQQVLEVLGCSEETLVADWEGFMREMAMNSGKK